MTMLSLNKLFSRLIKKSASLSESDTVNSQPLIIARPDHTISRKMISPHALKVLYGLKDAGYEAYLVGGCVRDLLLGFEPKDFDVATNASPEQVHQLFRKSRLIGRRFKLVHVGFGRNIIEVATFRAPPEVDQHVDIKGKITRDNVFGTLEQDAWRRDFTINALYYNIRDFSIIDYTGGIADLEAGKIRLIGDVETRYREDPVRMLRALRFVGKLGLALDNKAEAGIMQLASLLRDIPPARLFDEVLKLYLSGQATINHELLCRYGIFDHLFTQTATLLNSDQASQAKQLLINALDNTDKRISEGKPVTPAFLFAALLWEPVHLRWMAYQQREVPIIPALQKASTDVISEQIKRIAVPKRFSLITRDIWMIQPRLEQRFANRPLRLLEHPKFRAGYDFLVLRSQSDPSLRELAEWWTQFQIATESEQLNMIRAVSATTSKRKSKRRRRRKPKIKKNEE